MRSSSLSYDDEDDEDDDGDGDGDGDGGYWSGGTVGPEVEAEAPRIAVLCVSLLLLTAGDEE